MGIFDFVTKPLEAAAHAVASTVKKGVDAAEHAVKEGVNAVKEGAKSIANSTGWAGLMWRLNPITGPILQGVDTLKAVNNLVHGKGSVWDIPALGFGKGVGEGLVDAVKGVGLLAIEGAKSSPMRALIDPKGFQKQWEKNLHTLDVIVHHPLDVAKAIVKPIVDDVDGNRPYEAQGRIAFEALSLIFGPKGVDGLLNGIRGASKAGEAASVIEKAAEGAVAVEKAAEGASAAEKAAAAARAADAAAEAASAAAKASRLKLGEELFGDLSASERRIVERLDLNHNFLGDAEGGLHVAPGGKALPGSEATIKPIGTPRPNSTWKAEVTIGNTTVKKTMFPREWSPREVLDGIKDVIDHARPVTSTDGTKLLYEGTYRGVPMRVVVEKESGTILTSYPLKANVEFTR